MLYDEQEYKIPSEKWLREIVAVSTVYIQFDVCFAWSTLSVRCDCVCVFVFVRFIKLLLVIYATFVHAIITGISESSSVTVFFLCVIEKKNNMLMLMVGFFFSLSSFLFCHRNPHIYIEDAYQFIKPNQSFIYMNGRHHHHHRHRCTWLHTFWNARQNGKLIKFIGKWIEVYCTQLNRITGFDATQRVH